jgi:predicted nucleic acid-binding protein
MEATRVLIDSNLFIEHIRAKRKETTPLARIQEHRHRLMTSSIVAAELYYGARSPLMRTEVEKVLFGVEIVSFTAQMAWQVSIEAERLKARNDVISFRDLAIACAALAGGLPVATHNRAEFRRVDGLRLFDWEVV